MCQKDTLFDWSFWVLLGTLFVCPIGGAYCLYLFDLFLDPWWWY